MVKAGGWGLRALSLTPSTAGQKDVRTAQAMQDAVAVDPVGPGGRTAGCVHDGAPSLACFHGPWPMEFNFFI